MEILEPLQLAGDADIGNKKPSVRKAAACGDRTGAGNQAEDPVDGRTGRGDSVRGKQGIVQRPGEASA